jgi:hypothetical protein
MIGLVTSWEVLVEVEEEELEMMETLLDMLRSTYEIRRHPCIFHEALLFWNPFSQYQELVLNIRYFNT